jgi:hypothetical protein
LVECVGEGKGEKRQVGNPALSSAGSDYLSGLNAASGIFGQEKFRDTSTKAVLSDTTMSKAVAGQVALTGRQSPRHSFGPRRARLRPLTVGQVLSLSKPKSIPFNDICFQIIFL